MEFNSKQIKHFGRIVSVSDSGSVAVKFENISAGSCMGCAAALLCNVRCSGILTVQCTPGAAIDKSTLYEGARVVVELAANRRVRAVNLLLTLPCALFLGVALLLYALGCSDACIAAGAMAAAGLVYVGLFFFRRKSDWIIYSVLKD